jgi:DNA-binding NtrC family response regulator
MDEFARLNLIGRSPLFLATLALIKKYATCDATVLIEGETGTGKELAARAIHYLSRRRNLPFIGLNCGALPDNLVETELFGHLRGAFTDAKEARTGLVAQAKGGTLFLDEVEAISPRAQVALLRFLQDKEYRPIGGAPIKDANVRILASSNADLQAMVQKGSFRMDLLYRLHVLSLHMPPLRDRLGDAVLLADLFVERLNRQSGEPPKALHPDAVRVLNGQSWPGNVRELENLIQREFVLAKGPVIELTGSNHGDRPATERPGTEPFNVAKARAVAQFERAYMAALLARTNGNLSLAARVAGKDRSDIGRLARKHGFDRSHFLRGRDAPG